MRPTRRRSARRSTRRFTLIELMVVIAIIGLLGTLVAVNVSGSLEKARIELAEANIRRLAEASRLFRMEYHRYPRSLGELLDPPPLKGRAHPPFFDALPVDPWDREYLYRVAGREFEIETYGADGQPGGEGEDYDISWSDLKTRGTTR